MKTVKSILYIVILLALITISCIVTKRLFVTKISGGTETIKSFYAQKENSLDVVFVGSSRVYCDIDPAVLWEEKGIASYDFATAGQLISASALAVDEIFKTQSPKLVVLEVSQIDNTHYVPIEMNSIMTYLKPSRLKYETMYNYSKTGYFMDNLINYSYYHNKYSEVTKNDKLFWDAYKYPKSGFAGYKGFYDTYTHKDMGSFNEEIIMDEKKFSNRTMEHLEKILGTCRAHNAELFLIFSPDTFRHDYTKLHEFADKNGLRYINANYILDDIGFDPKEDFLDADHLNGAGAKKWSKYLAGVISDVYNIPSHKGDDAYYSWEENALHLKYAAKSVELADTGGLGDYFYNYYPDPNYIMIVSLLGEYDTDFYGQRDVLQKTCGISGDLYDKGGTWVFYNYEIKYYSGDDEELLWHEDVGGHTISVSGSRDEPEIYVDGIDYGVVRFGSKLKNGIQVITFDTVQNKLIDAIMYDNDDGFTWKRYEGQLDAL